jgi:hypothetical protein
MQHVATGQIGAAPGREMSLLEALRAALIAEMEADERVAVYGMDVGTPWVESFV